MSVSKLASGRWGAQVWDRALDTNVRVSKVLGDDYLSADGEIGSRSFRTKTAAKRAREDARRKLDGPRGGVTVGEWFKTWTTDPLWARPKESTDKHNAERVGAFAKKYKNVPIRDLGEDRGDAIVAEWLAGGRRNGTVSSLRAFINDAMSAAGGRQLARNPFAGLGLEKTKGNKDKLPPNVEQMDILIGHAERLTPPSFAAYLEFGCVTGIRVGEIDYLQWPAIRWDDGEVDVVEQWNSKLGKPTEPKYGPYTVALTSRGRDVLLKMKRQDSGSGFVFETLRGTHYTPSARTHHWNRVRSAAALDDFTLYLATRHHFGWYAINILGLDPAVVAEQFGHKDGGKLVEQLYGHPDKAKRRAKIRDAHDAANQTVRHLTVVRDESA